MDPLLSDIQIGRGPNFTVWVHATPGVVFVGHTSEIIKWKRLQDGGSLEWWQDAQAIGWK